MIPGLWVERAACRGRVRTMALPDLARDDGRRGGSSYTIHQRAHVDAARAVCASCPVFGECRAWALGFPDPAIGMVAAGMTPAQRTDARQRKAG